MGRARDDLAIAETLLAAESPAWAICYHVQQAVEKGLKALLVAAGDDPPKTHNLVRLESAVTARVFEASDDDMLASLTLWSVEQRYPADQPEPTRQEAQDALAFGRRAMHVVEQRLAQPAERPTAGGEASDELSDRPPGEG
jgi:HEPN domain-containing protein